jgi:hypothetical protein
MKNPTAICYKIASEAHANQRRWDGTAYMSHIIAVHGNLVKAAKEDTLIELDDAEFAVAECCALLHDVVEDCMTPDEFRVKLMDIGDVPMENLIYRTVVFELTHQPPLTYFDYIGEVKSKIALLVKYCDMQHNMSCSMKNIMDNHDVLRASKQLKKYGKALPIILGKLVGKE